MKKIATYIAEQQSIRLKALAETLGVTQSELLRRFLEDGLASTERDLHQRSQVSNRGSREIYQESKE